MADGKTIAAFSLNGVAALGALPTSAFVAWAALESARSDASALALLLPPAGLLVALPVAGGLLAWRKRPVAGIVLGVLSLGALACAFVLVPAVVFALSGA